MSSQQLCVNGTLIDLSQTQAPTETGPTLARRTSRPTVFQRNDLQGFGLNRGRRADFVSSDAPQYSPADQFFSGTERLAELPDELVAQMFLESLDRFPRAGSRQTLYTLVLKRLEARLSLVEFDSDAAELIDSHPDPEVTRLFLQVIDNLELRQQESVNYTDEELGLR